MHRRHRARPAQGPYRAQACGPGSRTTSYSGGGRRKYLRSGGHVCDRVCRFHRRSLVGRRASPLCRYVARSRCDGQWWRRLPSVECCPLDFIFPFTRFSRSGRRNIRPSLHNTALRNCARCPSCFVRVVRNTWKRYSGSCKNCRPTTCHSERSEESRSSIWEGTTTAMGNSLRNCFSRARNSVAVPSR